MSPLSVEWVGDPAAPRVGWFIHGILGRGRNWRTFARRVVDAAPEWRIALPDLRCHGTSPPQPAPHDLDACARDLEPLADAAGAPEVVVGHSFGGKVALGWLAARPPRVTWVLDAPPGPDRLAPSDGADPVSILRVLRSIPVPAPTREHLRAPLRAAGVPEPIVAWLASSATSDDSGWRFLWDLDGVEQLLGSYLRADRWPVVDAARTEVHLVRAGRSDRWTPAERERLEATRPPVCAHLIPDAGHWLHVDAPDATWALLGPSFTRPAPR